MVPIAAHAMFIAGWSAGDASKTSGAKRAYLCASSKVARASSVCSAMGTWLNAACAAWTHARRTAPNSDATPGSCTRDTPGCARSAEEKTSTATAMASRHEGWRCVTNASRRASSRWGSKGAAMVLAHSNDRVYTSHSASTTSGDDLQGSALRADRVGHAADSTATAGCSTTAPLLLARLENSRNLTAAAINRTSAPSRSRRA